MNKRENVLSLLRRQGYEEAVVHLEFGPSLDVQFRQRTGWQGDPWDYFGVPWREVDGIKPQPIPEDVYKGYYDFELKPGTRIDGHGVAHEPGSESARHMTYMRHPLKRATNLEEIMAYPLPDYSHAGSSHQKQEVEALHAQGLAAMGQLSCSIWETAWYIRSMEELMMDMMTDDPKAGCLLDRMAGISAIQAEAYAQAGTDILLIGDDIGMQRAPMMSLPLYEQWLKPRLKRVIASAKAVKPDMLVIYHSCGYVVPFIPHLIDAGIDVLNPVQPECMDFKELHDMYGDRLSFHGTIGTQTTMPFGTPEEVRRAVYKNLEIAGDKGGLMASPTHLLEPEVPMENVFAYVQACRDFKS
jgi:uroporphyrinogen decarboxylase